MIVLKILFKNKTTYSEDVYNEFLEFHRKKFGLKFALFNICIIALILTCIVYLVSYRNYTSAIMFCIILTIFIFLRYFKPALEVSNDYKSEKISDNSTFTFTFYDKYFTIKEKNDIYKSKYRNLYKIFETDNYFYLYIDKNHSFLLDKTGFIVGDSNDFNKFILHKKSEI